MAQRPSQKHGLRGRAAKFYNEMVENWSFSETEMPVLLEMARQIELMDRLYAELQDAETMIPGSRPGQMVVNGIISELRSGRLALASMAKQLDLPDDDEESAARDARDRASKARRAANVRWGNNSAAS